VIRRNRAEGARIGVRLAGMPEPRTSLDVGLFGPGPFLAPAVHRPALMQQLLLSHASPHGLPHARRSVCALPYPQSPTQTVHCPFLRGRVKKDRQSAPWAALPIIELCNTSTGFRGTPVDLSFTLRSMGEWPNALLSSHPGLNRLTPQLPKARNSG
jgi:hypothetical protein